MKVWLFLLLAVALPAGADIPKHLVLARELVANIKPEHNRYSLGDNAISFPGDLLSNKYSMRADCSGFLVALFDRAQYSTQSRMVMLEWSPSRRKYKAEDFVHSIENEKGFKRIQNIEDIRPGDILAHAMLNSEDKRATGTTGHVSLIDSVPRPIPPRKPVVEGTRQYEVSVIDSNEEHVGEDDTRLADPANKIKGLGKGTLRLYADSAGEVVGWARTFKNSNRFFSYTPRFPSDTKARKAAVGRPVTEN